METLLSIAIALCAGLLVSRFVKPLKLPAVTGYLIAGILIGPYCLNLVPQRIIDGTDFLSDIALAFIAFSTGEFFKRPCPEPRDRQDAPAAPTLQGGRLSDSRRPTVLLARVRPLFRHARAVLPAAAGGKAGAYAPRDGAAACDFLAAERFSGRRTGPC